MAALLEGKVALVTGAALMPIFATLTSAMDIRPTTMASLPSMLLASMNVWIAVGRLATRSAGKEG